MPNHDVASLRAALAARTTDCGVYCSVFDDPETWSEHCWVGRQSCVVGCGEAHFKRVQGAPALGATNHRLEDAAPACVDAEALPPTQQSEEEHAATSSDVAVTEDVFDEEEPIAIPPVEAVHIANELWASGLQRAPASLPLDRNVAGLQLLTFHRHSKAIEDCLLASPPAEARRAAGDDPQPAWAGGAKVFVPGIGPEIVDSVDMPLRVRHALCYAADVPVVHAALRALPKHERTWQKRDFGTHIPGCVSLFQEASADAESCGSAALRLGSDVAVDQDEGWLEETIFARIPNLASGCP